MERIRDYCLKKYPSRFGGKALEVEDKGTFWKVYAKDVSPVFLSKNI